MNYMAKGNRFRWVDMEAVVSLSVTLPLLIISTVHLKKNCIRLLVIPQISA